MLGVQWTAVWTGWCGASQHAAWSLPARRSWWLSSRRCLMKTQCHVTSSATSAQCMRKLAKVGPCMVVVKCNGVSPVVCVFVGHLRDICYEKALCVQVMQQIQVYVCVPGLCKCWTTSLVPLCCCSLGYELVIDEFWCPCGIRITGLTRNGCMKKIICPGFAVVLM